ncbi:hypothetical protein [Natronolimnohabitans innermongolicus]|nr:hypothetical protein [Natronolimnohabitans innermongolicus]
MTDTGVRRRDLLLTVSAGCGALAGCSNIRVAGSGYGTAYAYSYGTD